MNPHTLSCTPIGTFISSQSEKYMAPKQSDLAIISNGKIILSPNQNFEQAVEDLEGFDRIWVLYWFDRNSNWKPKVSTPRGGKKRGVFSTRSPHRPNPIGLSAVELIKVEGREIFVGKNDLLDGTPILDIKPYLVYADAFPESAQGWLEDENNTAQYDLTWLESARLQAEYIESHTVYNFIQTIELRLRDNPFPFPNHRIKMVGENEYELSVKTWKIHYDVSDNNVCIRKISSGYDLETLQGIKTSRWDDVPLHRDFISQPFNTPTRNS